MSHINNQDEQMGEPDDKRSLKKSNLLTTQRVGISDNGDLLLPTQMRQDAINFH
jgi:hypothetical protein